MDDQLRQISIDQLIPGMFVVGVDVPWYQTPFLSHKLLISDRAIIDTMIGCGIRSVTIDVQKGIDLSAYEHGATPSSNQTASHNQPDIEAPAEQPLPRQDSIQALYAEAQDAIERVFTDLAQGNPPSLASARIVVSNVLTQIIHDRTAVMTHLTLQRIKQFDRSLAAHALDTCILSLVIAVESELDEGLQARLGTGALLHDAGYVRFPRHLVRRRAECSEKERLLLQRHPSLGVALLTGSPGIDEEIMRIVAEHHERGNGSGFPAGLKQDSISQLSQIVGVVDWYDGMVSRRGGRLAMLPHDAVRRLFLAGEQGWFPKSLVKTMIRSIGVYPLGSLVLLNTGEQAVVVGANARERLKPIVKIVGGPQGKSYTTPLRLDLATQPNEQAPRTIQQVLDPTRELVNVAMYLDATCEQAAS
ncbi:MAG: DUF3391 domain-containing protein [Nitrospira sp.]|nr:DUF3391 domain-containing protein [Nitrospira sp.]